MAHNKRDALGWAAVKQPFVISARKPRVFGINIFHGIFTWHTSIALMATKCNFQTTGAGVAKVQKLVFKCSAVLQWHLGNIL